VWHQRRKRRPFPLRFRLKLQSRLNLQSLKQI